MPGASYLKPDAERRNRHQPAFGWTVLPERQRRRPPPLPAWRHWSPATLDWWRGLWARPQAAAWDRSGLTLAPAALVFEAIVAGETAVAPLVAELRQHYDRHGLSPKAMSQLRWRVAELEEAPRGNPRSADRGLGASSARRRRLARGLELIEGSQ